MFANLKDVYEGAPPGRTSAGLLYERDATVVPWKISAQQSRGQECPRHASKLAFEIGYTIPHQLDGDGENQEAENLVDGSDRAGSKPSHQRSAKPEEQQH